MLHVEFFPDVEKAVIFKDGKAEYLMVMTSRELKDPHGPESVDCFDSPVIQQEIFDIYPFDRIRIQLLQFVLTIHILRTINELLKLSSSDENTQFLEKDLLADFVTLNSLYPIL